MNGMCNAGGYLYPMLLHPTGKDYLWGGSLLKTEYGKNLDITPLAETWECSTHPDGRSVIINGAFAKKTLAEVLARRPDYVGSGAVSGELPLLVKLIDASQDLSVQVHPDDTYAKKHEGQIGKTEMWYVLHAEEGAEIIYGFARSLCGEKLVRVMETGEILQYLRRVKVHAGDVFFIPPGAVHAIGKGILLAEVQQSSNITYRIHDYGRLDKDGRMRELHIHKAADVIQEKTVEDSGRKSLEQHPGYALETLCECPYFCVQKLQIQDVYDFSVSERAFQTVLCLEGGGEAASRDGSVKIIKGSCVFFPASAGDCRISGEMDVLLIRP